MAWAPSARVVNSSTWLLPRLAGGWDRFAQPNGFPQISMGDAIENAGASVAINDLLATVHGHMNMSALVLFAGGWPKGQAVSFRCGVGLELTCPVMLTRIYATELVRTRIIIHLACLPVSLACLWSIAGTFVSRVPLL
eukprot:COSAG02_NODE_10379_length_1955_cov_0.910022_2_plen_138_part_00